MGAELIGVDSVEADAEMIAMAVEGLKEVREKNELLKNLRMFIVQK